MTVEIFIFEGIVNFYCGMAMGFDLIAATAVLKAKEKHPEIKLIACIPCAGQERYYPAEEKNKYGEILARCDKIERIGESYYKGCMLVRDRFMVDNCERVLAYMDKNVGGTAYTVRYARSKSREVYFL